MSICFIYSNIFWNALSAIGSLTASIVALYLGLSDKRKKLCSALVWDGTTDCQPELVISNTGTRLVVLKEIRIKYKRHTVLHLDTTKKYHILNSSAFPPNSTQKIKIGSFDFKQINDYKSPRYDTLHNLIILLRDVSGKRFRTKQKYSDSEIQTLLVGQQLLSR